MKGLGMNCMNVSHTVNKPGTLATRELLLEVGPSSAYTPTWLRRAAGQDPPQDVTLVTTAW